MSHPAFSTGAIQLTVRVNMISNFYMINLAIANLVQFAKRNSYKVKHVIGGFGKTGKKYFVNFINK